MRQAASTGLSDRSDDQFRIYSRRIYFRFRHSIVNNNNNNNIHASYYTRYYRGYDTSATSYYNEEPTGDYDENLDNRIFVFLKSLVGFFQASSGDDDSNSFKNDFFAGQRRTQIDSQSRILFHEEKGSLRRSWGASDRIFLLLPDLQRRHSLLRRPEMLLRRMRIPMPTAR